MKKGMKRYSAWRITSTEDEEHFPVGKILIDHGRERTRVWEWINLSAGTTTSVVGERICELCPTCVSDFGYTGQRDHEGAHGVAGGAPRAPELIALTEAAKAKEQVGG